MTNKAHQLHTLIFSHCQCVNPGL